MLMVRVMSFVSLIAKFGLNTFCMFSEDYWTFCISEETKDELKSLPRQGVQSEMVCIRIIVTSVAL